LWFLLLIQQLEATRLSQDDRFLWVIERNLVFSFGVDLEQLLYQEKIRFVLMECSFVLTNKKKRTHGIAKLRKSWGKNTRDKSDSFGAVLAKKQEMYGFESLFIQIAL